MNREVKIPNFNCSGFTEKNWILNISFISFLLVRYAMVIANSALRSLLVNYRLMSIARL